MKFETFSSDLNRHSRFFLGLYIRRKRHEHGLSVDQVAALLQLTPQIFKRIESGHSKLTEEHYYRLHAMLTFDKTELENLQKISRIAYVNDLAQALGDNYPA